MTRLLFVIAAAATLQAAPRLAPVPRQMILQPGRLVVEKRLASLLTGDTKPSGPQLLAGLASDPHIRRELKGKLVNQPESYYLRVDSRRILIAGADEAGVFYGIQTLRQLLEGNTLPLVEIEDAPALRYRGLSIDISRGPILTQAQLESVIRTLASFKMNMLTLYMEHVFPYKNSPLVAPKGSGITAASMRQLSEYASRYHIDLVPQQQTFGHLHNMLKLELYNNMAETPYGSVLAAEDERAYQWIDGVAKELVSVFKSPFLHIGSDETVELGRGRTKALAEKIGVGQAYILHMRRVTEMLKPLNKEVMFWGDIALSHPELMPELPKSLIAMTWEYDPKPDYTSFIQPFKSNGMKVMVCPGLSNWFRIYPSVDDSVKNIDFFVRDGKKLGVSGMLNTHWNDEGETLFNLNWYGIVFSAAAAWQEGPMDPEAFARNFDWTFHRLEGNSISTVVQRFAKAHELLRGVGLKYASDQLFWMDPFSGIGARNVQLALPVASEIRKLAEQNQVDLAALEGKTLEHADTLRFLALASKRLDYLGMKIIFSNAINEKYRAALATKSDQRSARGNLRRITSTNGYVEDLREAIFDIRSEYKAAWLAENQPYWLDNVLVKYDAEAMYWQRKANVVNKILQNFLVTNELPEDLPQ